jgi:asparagine synthase (glutamine-hydrolysing)
MCGITGFLTPNPADQQESRARVHRMTEQIVHRGPDDSGVWMDPEAGLALGFRRLAILDLTPEGHQPMLSACGRYVIAFNGEIYNFNELRAMLEPGGHKFRGHSDTEVMLASVQEWGLAEAVKMFIGMFAFALWDRHTRTLHLVRDRLGIKPLYYGLAGRTFLFGSELKALRAHPDFRPEVNRDALALQLRYGYIPQPYSIFKGIYKLTPGCILTVAAANLPFQNLPQGTPYWSAEEVHEKAIQTPFKGPERDAVGQLDTLLREAVLMRMVADVPLGAFLSGGVDSSTVVALMQAQSTRPVKTFTIGFYEDSYNEARHAKAVAAHLGTDHTELYVTADQASAVIPKLPTLYDEPFADSSQIPTYLVSVLARQRVTVSLSGDGGDELFGGYERYLLASSVWKAGGWLPFDLRRILSSVMSKAGRRGPVGNKLHKLAQVLNFRTPEALYDYLISYFKESVVLGAVEPQTVLTDARQWASLPEFTQRMMFLDLISYLPDDILTKVDRASMGVSLEARVPLLDHRVVEFVAQLPLHMKIRKREAKWSLRQVVYQYVPKELIERPKMGFSVPIGEWLRGSLRGWAEDLLSEGRLRRDGFLCPEPVRKLWLEHLSGRRNWEDHLWNVLMFQAWLTESRRPVYAPTPFENPFPAFR